MRNAAQLCSEGKQESRWQKTRVQAARPLGRTREKHVVWSGLISVQWIVLESTFRRLLPRLLSPDARRKWQELLRLCESCAFPASCRNGRLFFWLSILYNNPRQTTTHNQPPPCLRMSIWNALPSSMASVSITMSASARDRPERATPVPRRLRTTAVCAQSCTRRSAARRRSR